MKLGGRGIAGPPSLENQRFFAKHKYIVQNIRRLVDGRNKKAIIIVSVWVWCVPRDLTFHALVALRHDRAITYTRSQVIGIQPCVKAAAVERTTSAFKSPKHSHVPSSGLGELKFQHHEAMKERKMVRNQTEKGRKK